MASTDIVLAQSVSGCPHAVCYGQPYCSFDGHHAERHATDVCGDTTALRMAIEDAHLSRDVHDVALAHVAIRADNYVTSHHRTYAASLRMVEQRTGLSQRRVQEATDALKDASLGEFQFVEVQHALPGTFVQRDGASARVASTFAFVRVVPASAESLGVQELAATSTPNVSITMTSACVPSAPPAIAPLRHLVVSRRATLPVEMWTPPNGVQSPTPTAPDNTQTVVGHLSHETLSNAPADVAARMVMQFGSVDGGSTSSTLPESSERRYVDVHDFNGNGCRQDSTERCGAPFDHVHGDVMFADYFTQEDVEWADKHGTIPGFWLSNKDQGAVAPVPIE